MLYFDVLISCINNGTYRRERVHKGNNGKER